MSGMNATGRMFSDSDLRFLIKFLMPGCRDTAAMMRALKEDEEILEGMLGDEKLFSYIMDSPEAVIRVSPSLFFTVLLHKAMLDLAHQSYTVEHDDKYSTIIFDSGEVAELIQNKRIRYYLAAMLASFVRINSFSIPIRVRKNTWRKIRFSDFDIDSLIRYSQVVAKDQRYQTYKRIGDICLFTLGIFPDHLHAQAGRHLRPEAMKTHSRQGLAKHGKYFYKIAAQQEAAQEQEIDDVLHDLSDKFDLASKPLSFMSGRYLGFIKHRLFLQ